MLIDGRSLPPNSALAADLCIVGAGPAGLALVRELRDSRIDIYVVERGGLDSPTERVDLEFESPDFSFAADVLPNQVGGMATTWNTLLLDGVTPAARYLPLDPIDFDERPWVPFSGWPISYDQLRPFYDRARTHCGLAPLDFQAPVVPRSAHPLTAPAGRLITTLDQLGGAQPIVSDPVRVLAASHHIHLLTHAAAVEFRSSECEEDHLASVLLRTKGGQLIVRSRLVVLAAGAIENARLLLNSSSGVRAGIGNETDNVGRFFMDHPRVLLGRGTLSASGSSKTMEMYSPHFLGEQVVEGRLKLPESILRSEQLLNGNAQIFRHPLSLASIEGVRAMREVARAIRRHRHLTTIPGHLSTALRRTIPLSRDLFNTRYNNLTFGLRRGRNERPDRAMTSFQVIYQPEQAPNPHNRVTLSSRRDAFGYPIARLAWRWSRVDLESIRRVRQIVASELRSSGLGTLRETDEDATLQGDLDTTPSTAHHHLGTTRMHELPRHGVVDRNCRVHGSASVYVAGGSVFTTGSYANPTLTVIALTIRLADELKRVLAE